MRDGQGASTGIPALIKHLQDVDRDRRAMQPSTPAYHRAAAEVERLSRRIFEEAKAEEAKAEEARARREAPYGWGGGGSPRPQE